MSKEAMKLALEALECLKRDFDADQFEWGIADEAITALREALAEQPAQQEPVKWSDYEPNGTHHNKPQKRPQNCGTGYCSCIECVMEPAQQKPVAWMTKDGDIYKSACWPEHEARPLVFGDTSPPAQCTWVSLTDEEIESIFNNWPTYHLDHEDFARVIEAKLKEKNT